MALALLRRVGNVSRAIRRQAIETRNFAEERDCYATVLATQYYRHFRGRDPARVSKPEIDKIVQQVNNARPLAHRQMLYEVIEPQILEMFSYIERLPGGAFDPYPEPEAPEHLLTDGTELEGDARVDAEVKRRQELEARARRDELALRRKAIPHPGGFRLRLQRSSVQHSEAGFGVLVEGRALPGTVLALYPGTIYFPVDPLGDGRPFNVALPEQLDNAYLIRRYDDILIDGREWHLRALKLKAQSRALREAGVLLAEHEPSSLRATNSALAKFRNPYAIANFFNHPPKGRDANVMQWSYTFRRSFPEHLQRYIPHEYRRAPGLIETLDWSVLMPSMVAIATRVIENEEIFMNYRLNPHKPHLHPDWYHQPDPEGALLRYAPMRKWWWNPF